MALIGEILVQRGACTPERLAEALDDQLVYDGRLGTNLLEAGAVTEEQLARALSVQHGIPATWGEIAVEARALAAVPAPRARRLEAVPVRLERRRLDVLVMEVRDLARLDDLAFATGKEIHPVIVPEARLWQLLRRYYGVPCPPRRARAARRDGPLASNQELLAELQRQVGAAGRPRPAPARSGDDGPFVSDAEILADLQDEADRRYRALGLPLQRTRASGPTPAAPAAIPPGRPPRH